ncbi:MAG: PD-(D/E)XK nuclease family protein [Patescibacteria group bacterium]
MAYYPYRRRKLYDPNSKDPFTVSRSKIDLFIDCPRCFYLDRKHGVSRPGIPSFTLNSAVDTLLKKEFDLLRKNGESHELMKKYKIDAIPLSHPELATWRDDHYRYIGASILHDKTNFLVTGIIDDVWKDKKDNLIIVDYKATSTTREISLEDKWKQSYKRQMEIYQWIFRRMGFKVSDTGYFVFANAGKNRDKFDGKLEFELSILPYKGDGFWVEPRLLAMKKCLDSPNVPNKGAECEHCSFREKANEVIK